MISIFKSLLKLSSCSAWYLPNIFRKQWFLVQFCDDLVIIFRGLFNIYILYTLFVSIIYILILYSTVSSSVVVSLLYHYIIYVLFFLIWFDFGRGITKQHTPEYKRAISRDAFYRVDYRALLNMKRNMTLRMVPWTLRWRRSRQVFRRDQRCRLFSSMCKLLASHPIYWCRQLEPWVLLMIYLCIATGVIAKR